MILVDANLLIYAVDRDSPHHVPARRWLEDTLSGSESVGIMNHTLVAVGLGDIATAGAALEAARRLATEYVQRRLGGESPYHRPEDRRRVTTALRIAPAWKARAQRTRCGRWKSLRVSEHTRAGLRIAP